MDGPCYDRQQLGDLPRLDFFGQRCRVAISLCIPDMAPLAWLPNAFLDAGLIRHSRWEWSMVDD